MKFIISIIFALILTGCASTSSVQFSPSQDYAVSVQSNLFDAVRIANNDITLFNDGKALGFIRLEPIPSDAPSISEFINTLRLVSESESVETEALGLYPGFQGFSAKVRGYQTGYLINGENPSSILIFSFPEGTFENVAKTISSGI
ncbi:hypothetical protein [Marinobacter sp. SS8-8]|uniref:hypothetical protein n=1 Tax=Marinobacter sp. SS8-8 TaxID=3050452 RepID=UPI0026DFB3CD|nr:hypothetical protein [Marinobacter sp. SS8-8]|tara:strand:+ start:550 stop:987 length:438 start_codon:yes stop_codon:yes gene_type:complete